MSTTNEEKEKCFNFHFDNKVFKLTKKPTIDGKDNYQLVVFFPNTEPTPEVVVEDRNMDILTRIEKKMATKDDIADIKGDIIGLKNDIAGVKGDMVDLIATTTKEFVSVTMIPASALNISSNIKENQKLLPTPISSASQYKIFVPPIPIPHQPQVQQLQVHFWDH
jgi:hypothetical protein